MNTYKVVVFVEGGKNLVMTFEANSKADAARMASRYGTPRKVELVCSLWWNLIWVVLFGLGFYAGQML